VPVNYTLQQNLAVKTIDDEIFILDRTTNTLHTFNGVGGAIWRHLSKNLPFDDIVTALVGEYEIDRGQAEADLVEFLNKCETEKILRLSL
jgi:hypothetical protein